MGTRNLTMVIANGETKVAQYGQWDGYPDGQGATALEFLRNTDLTKFKEKILTMKWLSKEDAYVTMKQTLKIFLNSGGKFH